MPLKKKYQLTTIVTASKVQTVKRMQHKIANNRSKLAKLTISQLFFRVFKNTKQLNSSARKYTYRPNTVYNIIQQAKNTSMHYNSKTIHHQYNNFEANNTYLHAL